MLFKRGQDRVLRHAEPDVAQLRIEGHAEGVLGTPQLVADAFRVQSHQNDIRNLITASQEPDTDANVLNASAQGPGNGRPVTYE